MRSKHPTSESADQTCGGLLEKISTSTRKSEHRVGLLSIDLSLKDLSRNLLGSCFNTVKKHRVHSTIVDP